MNDQELLKAMRLDDFGRVEGRKVWRRLPVEWIRDPAYFKNEADAAAWFLERGMRLLPVVDEYGCVRVFR